MKSISIKYSYVKKVSKKEYGTLVKTYCPALNEEVYFNSLGFKHLRFKIDGSPRNPKEAIFKMQLVPYIKEVISTCERFDEHRAGIKNLKYWSLVSRKSYNEKKIKVIVRRIGKQGKLHFWSVMTI